LSTIATFPYPDPTYTYCIRNSSDIFHLIVQTAVVVVAGDFFILLPFKTTVTGYGFHRFCLSVYLHDISTIDVDAARITELDTYTLRDESWKSVYFGVKRSKVKSVTKTVAAWVFVLL